MDTIVCVKQVLNPCLPVEIDHETGRIKEAEWTYIINPYDEVALEQAIRIREREESGSVLAISLGPGRAKHVLRRCLAIGADEAIHVQCETPYLCDPYAVAVILARVISTLKYDLILCGRQAIDWPNGAVGIMIGELLRLPVVTSVVKVAISADGKSITALSLLEKGDKQEIRFALPALVTTEMALCEPRYPSLSGIKRSINKKILKIDLESLSSDCAELGLEDSLTKLVNISRPPPRAIFVPPSNLSPSERIKLLASGGVKRKESNLLEGSADQTAKKIIAFLIQKNILVPPGEQLK